VNELIIYGLAFATVVFLVLSVFIMISNRGGGLDRLDDLDSGEPALTQTSLVKRDSETRFTKLLQPFRDRLEKEDVETKSRRANLMQMAGFYNPNAFTILYVSRIVIAVIVTALTALVFSVASVNVSPQVTFLIIIWVALLGYFFPLLYVRSRVSERQQKFRDGLPDAMDMLLVSLEAGLSFPASLKHVAKEVRDVHPIISEQFEIVTLEFQAGRQRAVALRNLADRVDIPEIHGLTTMIVQSEQLGTSLTSALRASAEDLRRDRMLKAEEKANALPVKMSLPLVGCIFPTLFAIILAPIIVRIVRVL